MTEEHFIFPLGTVLYPDGKLPLRIFEQRYLEMTKTCLREERPFGVCLIREGREVGTPAVPENIGCLARIESWDMPQLGVFQLLARGTDRFRLLDTRVAGNGLLSGTIEHLTDEPSETPVDPLCRELLQRVIERVGEEPFPAPLALDDPSWVAYRLAEILPFPPRRKQALLELDGPDARMDYLRELLAEHGLSTSP